MCGYLSNNYWSLLIQRKGYSGIVCKAVQLLLIRTIKWSFITLYTNPNLSFCFNDPRFVFNYLVNFRETMQFDSVTFQLKENIKTTGKYIISINIVQNCEYIYCNNTKQMIVKNLKRPKFGNCTLYIFITIDELLYIIYFKCFSDIKSFLIIGISVIVRLLILCLMHFANKK